MDQQNYLPVTKRQPLALVRGSGSRVWDSDGKEYIDALAGIAVNSIGHCHPHVVEAVRRQAGELMHISAFYVSEPQVELSRRLVELSGMERIFIGNSGMEAVECALKLARRFAHSRGRGGTVLAFEGCFHGRSLAQVTLGAEKYRQGYEPQPAGYQRVPFADLDALKAAITDEVGAIILEPVQGEGGVRPFPPEFLQACRALCDANDMALVYDEVQCGIGRTGRWFGHQHSGVKPDVMALAKAMGGGFPIGACLCNGRVREAIQYGDHGTTFGGNPLACSAALATLEVIEQEQLVERAAEQGARVMQRIRTEMQGSPLVKDVRGLGLMIGVELSFKGADVVSRMREHGVLSNCTADTVMRLVPPLNMPEADLDRVVDVLLESIKEIGNG
ncbi:MAG: aspartate aminotransferase family protein [Planctomycetales bacterium]|nr:aspartate aminotransferase family protein [bacterium]UNM10060.1 MAG: aspartate aminotransferase family protein [Planctomycetales bacterium]